MSCWWRESRAGSFYWADVWILALFVAEVLENSRGRGLRSDPREYWSEHDCVSRIVLAGDQISDEDLQEQVERYIEVVDVRVAELGLPPLDDRAKVPVALCRAMCVDCEERFRTSSRLVKIAMLARKNVSERGSRPSNVSACLVDQLGKVRRAVAILHSVGICLCS